jgi:transposase
MAGSECYEASTEFTMVVAKCTYADTISQHQVFKSASQCAAYIGLVPIQNESGSSLRGRSRLSKAGNPVIRAKLYMAAISALQHNPDIKIQNQRHNYVVNTRID